jgi:hypothetical protein
MNVNEAAGEIVEDAELKIFAQAIAQYGDNSYWHYMQARVQLDLGEPDDAWKELKAGNEAPRNVWPQPFPYNTLFAQRYLKSNSEANRIVRGVIYTQFASDLPNFIKMKESYKEVCAMLALGYPADFGDDMLRFSGRMAEMEQIGVVHQNVAAVLASLLAEYAGKELLPSAQGKDGTLQKIIGLKETYLKRGKIAPNFPPWGRRVGSRATTPFQDALQRNDAAYTKADKDRVFTYKDMPALQKADWLIFAQDLADENKRMQRDAPLFKPNHRLRGYLLWRRAPHRRRLQKGPGSVRDNLRGWPGSGTNTAVGKSRSMTWRGRAAPSGANASPAPADSRWSRWRDRGVAPPSRRRMTTGETPAPPKK